MKPILFVCTGNVCRSPMAEGIFRQAVRGRGNYRVLSAGLGALEGQPPSSYAVQAVKELGIDISDRRSRALTPDLVQQADYIFGMTHSHIDTVMMLYPQAAEKTFLLREFDETLDLFEKDISDPIGGSYEVYLNCRDQIEQGIVSLLRFIEQSEMAGRIPANKAATIAIRPLHGHENTASLARRHNNANVLCLAGKTTQPEDAKRIVDAFLSARFEGGRHERRVNKMEIRIVPTDFRLSAIDPEIAEVIENERLRQQENIELIASENFTTPAVMEAQGSVLTNKYPEAHPKRRWYGGCENMSLVRQPANDRAKKLF